jgi:hypothetical protein
VFSWLFAGCSRRGGVAAVVDHWSRWKYNRFVVAVASWRTAWRR